MIIILRKNIILILSLTYILVTILLIYSFKLQYTFLNSMLFIAIGILLHKNKKDYIYIFLSLFISSISIFIIEYILNNTFK
ncbi:hypothetical protein CF049_00735 [Clostridium sporogenes]|nr:hypothetical protein RSJ11_04465 [Clostridium sporogenes]AVQ51879.1 hypothetical protein C7M59_02980 [Clostridium botulinum]